MHLFRFKFQKFMDIYNAVKEIKPRLTTFPKYIFVCTELNTTNSDGQTVRVDHDLYVSKTITFEKSKLSYYKFHVDDESR